MKKLLFILPLLMIGFYSCQNKTAEQNTTDSTQIDSALTINKLGLYKQYLAGLDSTAIESTNNASQKFQELFSGQTPSLCDSAYIVFINFYDKLETSISNKIGNDTIRYDSLLMDFGPNVRVRLSDKLLNFNKNLNDNGFRLAWDEGMVYVVKDGDFVEKRLFTLLSPTMKEYLSQENKESKAGFTSDAGLIIEAKDLADRAVWWEKFTKQHPDFIFANKGIENRKIYFISALTGMENTPALERESPGELTGYFKELYDYLLSTYPTSETAALIKPYYEARKQKNTKEAERLLNEAIKKVNESK